MTPPRVSHRRARGFTLVELLVAIALMTILTGTVVFIFIQSQKIFITVDAQVQVYQYARYAFDQMERDLANVVDSANMEFFDDLPPPTGIPGRYDPGEEVGTNGIKGTWPDGNAYRHAFTLRQPPVYPGWGDKGEMFRQDSIYFKTVLSLSGRTTTALVEFALDDMGKERPRMVKRLWKVTDVDASNPLRQRYQINGGSGEPLSSDLCLYAVESKIKLFARNRRTNIVGGYYEAKEFVEGVRRTLPNRQTIEVLPRHHNYYNPPPGAPFAGAGGLMVECFYDEYHDPQRSQADLGVFEPGEEGLFQTQAHYQFPMLKAGDRIWISGGGLQAKEYTIKGFVKPNRTPWEEGDQISDMRIEFEEGIEWPGSMKGQTLQVRYKASWLPPALRMTLRIKDAKSRETRTVERVFKILTST